MHKPDTLIIISGLHLNLDFKVLPCSPEMSGECGNNRIIVPTILNKESRKRNFILETHCGVSLIIGIWIPPITRGNGEFC